MLGKNVPIVKCALRFLLWGIRVVAVQNLSPIPLLVGLPKKLLALHSLQRLFCLLLVSLTRFDNALSLVAEVLFLL